MTNREAALKSCKDRLEHLENSPSHHYGKRQRQRAIELEKVKIEALRPITREQVEKMRGEWRSVHGLSEYYCSRCGEEFEIHSYDKDKYRFCPFCASPMTDDALDIVMKRLERMKGEA